MSAVSPPDPMLAWQALESALLDDPAGLDLPEEALGDKLLGALFAGGRPVLEMVALARLARAWDARQGRLRHPGWAQVVAHLRGQATALLRAGQDQTLVAAVAAVSLAEGRAAALRWLLGLLLDPVLPAARLAALHDLLWRSGLLGPEEAADFFAACRPAAPAEEAAAIGQLYGLLRALGFQAQRPMPYMQALVEGLLLPALLEAAARDWRSMAVEAELLLTIHWLKREETQAHYARWIARCAPALAACGRRQALPPPPAPSAEGLPLVALFVHVASSLAHVQAMLTMLEAIARLPGRRFRYAVHFLRGRDEAVFARLRGAGVAVVAHELPPDLPLARALDVFAARLWQAAPAALVWLCATPGLAYAFGRRLAPLQVWWSVKFHPPAAPDADLRLGGFAGQGREVAVDGLPWVNLPGSIDPNLAAADPAARAALRARFGGGPLLGSLAREEKMADPVFQDCVAQILRRLPEAHYLYTGRRDLPEFRGRLQAAGVAERAHFVGWVDTGLYAGLLDLCLDTFPMGGGLTSMQAIIQGVAPVFLACPFDAPISGVLDNYLHRQRRAPTVPAAERAAREAPLRDAAGQDLLPALDSPAAYVERACRLGADPALRQAVGQAARRYAERFLLDHSIPARAFEDAIAEALAVSPGGGTARTA